VHSESPEETQRAAAEIVADLEGGRVIALHGPLGSGKTVFVKGLARALGVTELVTSPSFSLVNEYEGRIPLYHVDLYRLSGVTEVADLDLDAYLYGPGVTVVEWAERAGELLPDDTLHVSITLNEDQSRAIRIGEDG
jgi:tRNA threonylcarbamoyladenosine biosynthesis protein TsaE